MARVVLIFERPLNDRYDHSDGSAMVRLFWGILWLLISQNVPAGIVATQKITTQAETD